jgi:hypothetical protein
MLSLSAQTVGIEKALKTLREIPKQVRYAAATALTWTAKDAHKKLLAHTRERFTIRKPWLRAGGRFGIRIDPAKGSAETIEARVYNQAPWMEDHERGAVRALKGGKWIWLYGRSGKRMRAVHPRATFAFEHEGMRFGRIGGLLVPTHTFKTAVTIRPTWGFEATGQAEANRTIESNWERAWTQVALRFAARELGAA